MPAADDPAIWDANAAVYARQEHLEARAVAALLRLAAPADHDRLLDVATGTGLVLRTLAAGGARPATVLGVDRSSGMLERVGPLPAGWTLRAGEATALPVPDDAADLVTCSYLLHLQSPADLAATLREIHRVLAPEGRVVLATPWSARVTVRAASRLVAGIARARLGGLRPLDPTTALVAAGLTPERRVVLPRGGYPSLVVLARR